MKFCSGTAVFLISTLLWTRCKSSEEKKWHDELLQKSGDLLLPATSDNIPWEELKKMKNASRVRLPSPCASLKAYSGFIPVDDGKNSTYLFFLHIKSQVNSKLKPLLLWMQGGPGKSSLFGQFLENGPLGMDATGHLFRRRPSILSTFNVVYLDAPAGSGYSFDTTGTYPSTLEESSVHTIRFLRRFLRIFPEYKNREFFIAGESYGARSAIGLAQRVLSRPTDLPCRLKGVMLGVGFVFPLLEIINSADYLYYSGLLDNHGRTKFALRFQEIQHLVDEQNPIEAAKLLYHTVFNMHPARHQSLFEELTGFQSHANIIRDRMSRRFETYMSYANSTEFKQIIHVSPKRALDATRSQLAMALAVGDFFVDKRETLVEVLNNVAVLFYTAQLDAVFPSVNMERSFLNLNWRGTEAFKEAARKRWYHVINGRKELMGYQKIADTVMYTTLLVSGHLVSFDQSEVVIDLYRRFSKFTEKLPMDEPGHKCGNNTLPCWPISIVL
ncbi:probable serine carboxypeptidase CPVL [Rhipicephalus sanguineus]|uniref:probable serine carboxypeptidase CPVL n=1 Tax=Rhipicephalus sanguineus TaxID=34632 RepID=UPI001893AB76|nr:probable serine carboxypeptidase CPVL [Rhipicephalus sanguineus]